MFLVFWRGNMETSGEILKFIVSRNVSLWFSNPDVVNFSFSNHGVAKFELVLW
jgi:hypothetical protein